MRYVFQICIGKGIATQTIHSCSGVIPWSSIPCKYTAFEHVFLANILLYRARVIAETDHEEAIVYVHIGACVHKQLRLGLNELGKRSSGDGRGEDGDSCDDAEAV